MTNKAYALTEIFQCSYIPRVATTFEVLAEPTRRKMLDLLLERPHLVGELTRRLGLSQPGTSNHLRWGLRPDGDGCLLTLTHTFDDRYGASSFASGWTGCFDILDLRLDGELAGPDNPGGVSPADLPQGLQGW